MTGNEKYASGQIIVMFKSGVTEEKATEIVKAHGWQKINWLKFVNLMLVAVPEGKEIECAAEIEKDAPVKSASLNVLVKLI